MEFKEYCFEDGQEVKLEKLMVDSISLEQYTNAHKNLPILCHDVFLKYKGGILLVTRDNVPAKDILWPIGGRIKKGVEVLKSLSDKVKAECGLDMVNPELLGIGRTYFSTDPFKHEKGTDTFNLVYLAEGRGELVLDRFHKEPRIITSRDYEDSFKNSLHPYVRDFMNLAVACLKNEIY